MINKPEILLKIKLYVLILYKNKKYNWRINYLQKPVPILK